jgi:hypothetical protein
MSPSEIEAIFTYHKPSGNQPERYVKIREEAKKLAHLINDLCPTSREKSIAITNIQQAVQWANASIAINENEIPAN